MEAITWVAPDRLRRQVTPSLGFKHTGMKPEYLKGHDEGQSGVSHRLRF